MECLTCLSLRGERRISPSPFIDTGTHWVVDHAYLTSHLGWLVILPKRHIEALHKLSREEFLHLVPKPADLPGEVKGPRIRRMAPRRLPAA
jgi:diadenosine tetraphosphate (Ap4A) HIT family hydrolase